MYAANEMNVIIDGIKSLSAHDKSIDLNYGVAASCETHKTDVNKNGNVVDGGDHIIYGSDVSKNLSESFSSDPSVIWITDSDTDGHETSESSIMNNTPTKRPSDGPESHPKRYNHWTCKRKYEESFEGSDSSDVCEIISSDDETYESAEEAVASHEINLLSSPSKIITTRSGRTVRAPVDNTFDYSSDADNIDADEDYEDDENDRDYNQHDGHEPKWMQSKQRRIWNHSCSSSSEASSRSHNDGTLLIYLNLKSSTAVVTAVPSDDTSIDNDTELKTSLEKFLDLVPRMRRLYNPMDNYNIQETQPNETPVQRFICPPTPKSNTPNNSIISPSNTPVPTPLLMTSTPNRPPSPCKRRRLSRKPAPPLTDEEFETKVLDDLVAGANACYIEKQIPDCIKEPIDLSGLPSQTERSYNCRQHKYIYGYLEVRRRYYRFFESLSTETLINLCHPYARPYKERAFSACKTALAKTVFNMLNHKVFYCGLKQLIIWKRSMKNLSSCIHSIEPNGQRVSKILLSENINYPSVLIKRLLHEMCHAAAFNYHGETGHGDNCRKWAYRAITEMPDLSFIEPCDPRYKYICSLCSNRSYGNIKFEDEEHLRCQYCQFDVIVEPYSADYLNRISFTQREPTAYRAFIKQHYMDTPGETHSAKMKALNANYSTMTKNMSQPHLMT